MDNGGDATRSNFIEILEQLDPLPDLPETGEDRFFSKEALDFQYATGAAENPLFPTWGSAGAEMASTGAAAAASAANAMTPPPSATAATPAIAGAVAVKCTPAPPARTCGTKRALPEPRQIRPRARPAAGASAADRTVFLRQRLGGESISSGNSSTSTCSDNGSASEDVAGEWEGVGGGSGSGSPGGCSPGGGSFSRSGRSRGGRAATAVTTAKAGAVAAAAATAAAAGSAGSSQAAHPAALRNRCGSSTPKSHRYKKPRARGGGGGSSSSGGGGGGGGDGGGYASWGALVKPLKQQWDHVETPAVRPSAGASRAAAAVPLESGSVCSVFSPEPRPDDTTAFSVEQCSAQAHPMAVASYVLRVRCGGGAHVVRRTWDDIVSLCTMLGRDLALPSTTAPSMVAAAAVAAAACDVGVGPSAGVGIGIGVDGGGNGGTRGLTASMEFTPADVLAFDAASGFLGDLLARPGMALVMPARRFLELEFLDGTLKGGSTDASRETTAHQVATMAASSVTPCSAPALAAAAPAASPSPASEGQTTGGLSRRPVTEGGSAQGGAVAPALAAGLRPGVSLQLPFDASRAALRLPAHPDAARDFAAVCRCLGQLGAAAFTSLPRVMGAAAFWPESHGGAATAAAAAAEVTAAGNGRPAVQQRGVALLA